MTETSRSEEGGSSGGVEEREEDEEVEEEETMEGIRVIFNASAVSNMKSTLGLMTAIIEGWFRSDKRHTLSTAVAVVYTSSSNRD